MSSRYDSRFTFLVGIRDKTMKEKVTDIVDAMILRRLIETLLDRGVVIVMTSK